VYQDYEKAIQKALEHIENHLTAEIDVYAISKQVGYSRFHFQRIFRKVTGGSVLVYVRERRMTESAKTLIRTDIHIIDLVSYTTSNPKRLLQGHLKRYIS